MKGKGSLNLFLYIFFFLWHLLSASRLLYLLLLSFLPARVIVLFARYVDFAFAPHTLPAPHFCVAFTFLHLRALPLHFSFCPTTFTFYVLHFTGFLLLRFLFFFSTFSILPIPTLLSAPPLVFSDQGKNALDEL